MAVSVSNSSLHYGLITGQTDTTGPTDKRTLGLGSLEVACVARVAFDVALVARPVWLLSGTPPLLPPAFVALGYLLPLWEMLVPMSSEVEIWGLFQTTGLLLLSPLILARAAAAAINPRQKRRNGRHN